jgi:hypothetical protein
MPTKTDSSATAPALGERLEQVREFNEKVVQAAKEAARVSLDAYEKLVHQVLEFEEELAGTSQLDWVETLTESRAKFVKELNGAYVKAARQVLK